MKKLIYIALLAFVMGACNESELTNFAEQDAIHFELDDDLEDNYYYLGDSLIYTFGGLSDQSDYYAEVDTLWLPLDLLGWLSGNDRDILLEVDQDETTATEGVHYEALADGYLLQADSIRTIVPVILYNDESLGEDPLVLTIRIVENDDFKLGLQKGHQVRVIIYNDVVKPPVWESHLKGQFDVYSMVKHRLILELNGEIPLPVTVDEYWDNYWDIRRWSNDLNDYLTENEVYDENGNRIYPYK